jgi:hypothetical protein
MVFRKEERAVIYILLIFLATFLWGLKNIVNYGGFKVAQLFANAIKNTLEYADKNLNQGLAENQQSIAVHMQINQLNDTLYIFPYMMLIKSQRNFNYFYGGYKVKCGISYNLKKKLFHIECSSQ